MTLDYILLYNLQIYNIMKDQNVHVAVETLN